MDSNQFKDVDIITAEDKDFLYVIKIIESQCNILVDCWQRQGYINVLHEDRVGVFHAWSGFGKQVTKLNTNVRVAGFSICRNNVLAFEYLYC
jgi:hypothetical protein